MPVPSIPPSLESLGAPVCARQARIYSKGNARQFIVERDSDGDATRTGSVNVAHGVRHVPGSSRPASPLVQQIVH